MQRRVQGQAFDRDSGMKWPIQRLKLYLQSIYGAAAVLKLFHDIQMTVVKSFLAVQARPCSTSAHASCVKLSIFDECCGPGRVAASPRRRANASAALLLVSAFRRAAGLTRLVSFRRRRRVCGMQARARTRAHTAHSSSCNSRCVPSQSSHASG